MSYNKIKTDIQVSLAKWVAGRSLKTQMFLGRIIGKIFYALPNSRKKVAKKNLELCFPKLSVSESKSLLQKNLISTGQGIMEMLAALWADDEKVEDNFTVIGFENLHQALQDGNGCLMLSCHTTSIEWGIRGLNHRMKKSGLPVGHMLARQHNNKLLEAHLEQARLGFVEKLIDKKDLRSLFKSVHSGNPVYYAPDQNFSYQVEFADFFEHPAATSVGTYKLASKGVKVLPWFCFRTADCQWQIEILPMLSNLATMSQQEAATAINQLFEAQIRNHPEQYLWVHRRFKNQPDGMANPYQ